MMVYEDAEIRHMHACIGPDNNVFVWNPAIIWIEGKRNLIIKPIMGMWFYKITTLLNNLYTYWNYTAESNTACYTLLYLLDTWINVFSQNSRYAREYTMLLLYKFQPSLKLHFYEETDELATLFSYKWSHLHLVISFGTWRLLLHKQISLQK